MIAPVVERAQALGRRSPGKGNAGPVSTTFGFASLDEPSLGRKGFSLHDESEDEPEFNRMGFSSHDESADMPRLDRMVAATHGEAVDELRLDRVSHLTAPPRTRPGSAGWWPHPMAKPWTGSDRTDCRT